MEFGILSLLPPVIAIVLALITRNVLPALFAGVWLGATMINGWNPFLGLYKTFSDFIIPSAGDPWNATVLIYCGLFGILIAFLQKTGGAHAIATAISNKVKTPRAAQGSTMLFGLIIFFEDYFNALTVGSVMRSVTDKMRVSREKLAYIVDSTSAPMCLLGPVSTWVVFVMGLIGAQYTEMGISESEYMTYIFSIPFNFYSILAIILVGVIVFLKWDFGPMAQAEYRARTTGKVFRDDSAPPSDDQMDDIEMPEGYTPKIRNMVVPIVVLVAMIPPLFLWTGGYPEKGLVTAFGEADGATSITIAAFTAGIVAMLMGMQQKLYSFKESMDIIVSGFRSMMLVYIILILAWSIGSVTTKLGTAEYIVHFTEQTTSPILIPVLLFAIGAVVAFTTGTSYGTFAIMIPIAMPLAASMDISMYLAIAAVFSGGIFGDHCSPISDTTILSSAGSGSDHIDHVNTQIPYAITAGVSGIISFLTVGITGSPVVALIVGAAVLLMLAFILNKTWGKQIPNDKITV
ncbi:Na+/H+ antiporter NhaC family protein [Lentibacillus cibarius]|uniref:Na+/H+ antiporter NhaC family protein n=2 Tax=Lentibacillus cibarius TaxID=2583219 RepID=A0A549YEQ8_9BACI|nr:Na+/H+ antiporter NhaC family protein [Lentibacillus cibarius]TMN23789.1 Na+/H+ antiporter NhaC family protein [Lentibacillus cibarius]TRM10362.1 Na+/H+ antiporter NhaC family protein [Lentibacillus cibarius]